MVVSPAPWRGEWDQKETLSPGRGSVNGQIVTKTAFMRLPCARSMAFDTRKDCDARERSFFS